MVLKKYPYVLHIHVWLLQSHVIMNGISDRGPFFLFSFYVSFFVFSFFFSLFFIFSFSTRPTTWRRTTKKIFPRYSHRLPRNVKMQNACQRKVLSFFFWILSFSNSRDISFLFFHFLSLFLIISRKLLIHRKYGDCKSRVRLTYDRSTLWKKKTKQTNKLINWKEEN